MNQIKITAVKFSPEEINEIKLQLQTANNLLNFDSIPEWENINAACHSILDVISAIEEKTATETYIRF